MTKPLPSTRRPHHRQRCGRPEPGASPARRLSIAVISKRELREGNTLYAQGGISAVLDATDSVESHVQDTLNAGAGLCDEDIVRTGGRARAGEHPLAARRGRPVHPRRAVSPTPRATT
jgi:hypothetical protein